MLTNKAAYFRKKSEKLKSVLDLWQTVFEQWAQMIQTSTHRLQDKNTIDWVITIVQHQKQQNITSILATPVIWLVNLAQTHHQQLTLFKLIY